MSCNGCRVLRKGCNESCVLRSSLNWIGTPEAQGHATLFLSKFFGRSDLLSLISSVHESQRPALFRSLLFEACGRTVNPVNGAVGLLTSGKWQLCQAAVDTVLSGGMPRPIADMDDKQKSGSGHHPFNLDSSKNCATLLSSSTLILDAFKAGNQPSGSRFSTSPGCQTDGREKRSRETSATSFCWSDNESAMTRLESGGSEGGGRKKLLNLFV